MAGQMNWQNQSPQQPGMGTVGYGMPNNPQPYPSTNFQPVPIPQPPFVGRFIDNLSEIVPNEVPMDGRAAIFPAKNLEEIYLKMWNSYGEMKTFRYILDQSQNLNTTPPSPQDNFQSEIMSRLDALEQKIAENTTKNGRQNSPKGGEK